MPRHPDYWKIKAAVLAAQLARLNIDTQLRAALLAAGLNPELNYSFNDAEETFIAPDEQVPQ